MNSIGLAIGPETALYPLYVSQGDYTTNLTKRYISATSNIILSTTISVYVCANFAGNVWSSLGTIYISSDERIKKNRLDVNDDTALDKTFNIQPKTY